MNFSLKNFSSVVSVIDFSARIMTLRLIQNKTRMILERIKMLS